MKKIDKFIDTYISMLNENIIAEADEQSNILAKVQRELVKIKVKPSKIKISSKRSTDDKNKANDKNDSKSFLISDKEILSDVENARDNFINEFSNITNSCKNMKTLLSDDFLGKFCEIIKKFDEKIIDIANKQAKENSNNDQSGEKQEAETNNSGEGSETKEGSNEVSNKTKKDETKDNSVELNVNDKQNN